MAENYYRYQEFRYSHGLDQFDDPLPGHDLKVELLTFEVVKKTPKGVWIRRSLSGTNICGFSRFVLDGAIKKYACPDKASTLASFLARKYRHRAILKSQLNDVESAIRQSDKLWEEMIHVSEIPELHQEHRRQSEDHPLR